MTNEISMVSGPGMNLDVGSNRMQTMLVSDGNKTKLYLVEKSTKPNKLNL